MPSRWLPIDMGLLLDPEYARLAFFRNFRQYPIAKIGDAETRMIVVEWGTQVDNGLAHIVFNGISPITAPALMSVNAYVENPNAQGQMTKEEQQRISQAQPAPQLGKEREKAPAERR